MNGPARRIGRYDDVEEIGQGGFATVYRASDPEHGRDVAIKVIRGHLGETEKRRFDRERQTMGRLGAHPNIIPLHDSGYTEDGEAFMVMELAAGGSLQHQLASRGPLDWADAVSIMVGIARAAEAAHAHGVLHRDIKPDNILIDAFDNPKLSDFGIAAVTNNATATTSTSATLAHAAPELLEGQQPSAAVDIYAIGSTLHNLIAGEAPFVRAGDETVTGLITRTLTTPPPDLRPLGVPDHIARIIEQAMAKDPAHRHHGAAELADALEAGLKNPSSATTRIAPAIPASATQVAPGLQPGPEPARRPNADGDGGGPNRLLIALLAAALLLAVGIGAVIALVATSDGDTQTSATTGPGNTETTDPEPPPTSAPATTATPTTPTTASTTPSTTTTIVEVDLRPSSSAFASSEGDAGVDACGNDTEFGASNILDGDPTTAWRTPGAGLGDFLEISLDGTKAVTSVGAIPGYAKVDPCDGVDRFTQNRRIATLRWTVGDQVFEQDFDTGQPVMQSVSLPEPTVTDFVLIEIVSTTEDGGRDFTAISDIAIVGG